MAAVSSFATVAGLLMPQIIGHLGDVIELRKALTVACAAAVLSFVIARAVRTEGPLFRSHGRIQQRRALARPVSGPSAISPDAIDLNWTLTATASQTSSNPVPIP